MDSIIKLIHCCNEEIIENNKNHNEIEIPIEKEKKIKTKTVIDKLKINNESLNLKSTEVNTSIMNTILNNTLFNNNNEINRINNRLLLSPSKKILNTTISNNYIHLNKNNLEIKKYSNSLISQNKQINNNSSNKGTILTLNDLILINQNPEEKNLYEMGSKLLLSGELFFWKEIIALYQGEVSIKLFSI